jgi:C4-type Zn-finger protein
VSEPIGYLKIGDVEYPVVPPGETFGSRCPECGNECEQTCMGYWCLREGTVDTNKAACAYCGWRGHSFQLEGGK